MFGVSTTTLDAAGDVIERAPMTLTRGEVEAAVRGFVGTIEQVPPMVSAVKQGGRRLYELARAGFEVERAPRSVSVHRYHVERFTEGDYPETVVLVECSSGTYVRSLAADLGTALGGRAHLAELRRLRVGSFTLDEARAVDAVVGDPASAVLPMVAAVRDLEVWHVDSEHAARVAHGHALGDPPDAAGPGPFAIVGPDGELLAVYERRDNRVAPAVVLAAAG